MTASFHNSTKQSITIFTDGSCHAQLKTGGWASIIMMDSEQDRVAGNDIGNHPSTYGVDGRPGIIKIS